MKYTSFAQGNPIADEVKVDFDMLGPLVLNWVATQVGGLMLSQYTTVACDGGR